jgi:solute carrier family 25 (mitochondrial aspartate/glutamate transporter), member 12/13
MARKEPVIPLPYKLAVGGIAGVLGTSIILCVRCVVSLCFKHALCAAICTRAHSETHALARPASSRSPLDMVKTRLQNQSNSAVGGLRYSGPIDCFRKIVAQEGWKGLYVGLRPNLIGVTPEKAIKLTINDVLREYFVAGNSGEGIRLWQEMASGAGAGFFQVAATNPMEIVKLRMQLSGEGGKQGATAVETVRSLGLRGLYKGTAATWLRDVPFSIVFFPLFANLKLAFNGNDSLLGLFAAGAISGSVAAGSVTPCDVIKTRLQVVGSRYTSIGNAATTILREEGPGAFLKGLQPRMIVQAPLFGITLLAFDLLKRRLASGD